MNKKLLIIVGGIAAVAALIITLIFVFSGEDSYRSIKVFEIDGSCKVERDGDSLDAFKNMALSSGDSLTVGDGSFARLKLDDDKYVYLEANTKINLTATGTANDSKTMVYIERGSMLTEVKKKLSATSSYDIVTPNTTMSIRGTKTLTEVYEDVLGAIKTSAAVVEGQVSFKTVQKDSTGKAVMVSTDLSVGQGFGVTTEKKDLLSQADIRQIAEDGKTADGQVAEETTHEELGTKLEAPAFSEDFLTNVVAVLARSREEDIEEGFVAENVTEEELNAAINVLNDVIDGKILLPASVEEYIISQTQPYYDEPVGFDEPVTSDDSDAAFVQQPAESELGSTADDTTLSEETEGDGDDTLDVDETAETPVVIEDGTDDSDSADVADDRTVDDQDDTDEAEDAEDDESDETDDDGSDEGDASDEDTEDGDEEDEDKENSEETEDEEKEEESEETEDETEQEQEEQTEEAPTQTPSSTGTDDGSTGTQGSASETTPTNVSFSYGSTTAYVSVGSSSTDTQAITLSFYEVTSSGGSSSDRHVLNEGELPTTVAVGSALPGTQNSPIHVELGEQWSAQYEFDGWYTSANGARDLNQSEKVTVAQSGITSLYPGVKEKTFTVTFVNLFPEAGNLVAPQQSAWGNLTYDVSENRITVSGYRYGQNATLPEPMSTTVNERENVIHIEGSQYTGDVHLPLFCGLGFGQRQEDGTITGGDNINISRALVGDNEYYDSLVSDGRFMAYRADTRQQYANGVTVESNMTFYLYFAIPVEIIVEDPDGDLEYIRTSSGSEKIGVELAKRGYDSEQLVMQPVCMKEDTDESHSQAIKEAYDQYWNISRSHSSSGEMSWKFMSYYFGKPLDIPVFEYKFNGMDYQAVYYLTSIENGIPENQCIKPYANTVAQDRTSSVTFSGSGSESGFPYGSYKRDGKLLFSSIRFELVHTYYAELDLSETGLSIMFGENDRNVIRTLTEVETKKYRVRMELEETGIDYDPYVGLVVVPEDGLYDWEKNGVARTSLTDQEASESFFVSKSGYRLVGYRVDYYEWTSEELRFYQCCMLNNYYAAIYYDDSVGCYMAEINPGYAYKKVFTPIFMSEGAPFDLKLTRQSGKILRTSWDDPSTENIIETAMDYYNIEISGLQTLQETGEPFVSLIDLTDIIAEGFGMGDSQYRSGQIRLNKIIKWDRDSKKYYICEDKSNGQSHIFAWEKVDGLEGFVPNQGNLTIPLKLLGKFTDIEYSQGSFMNMDFVRGIDHYNNLYIKYETTLAAGILCGRDKGDSEYLPWSQYVGLEENSQYAYTAVYSGFSGQKELTVVFSEEKDTLPNNMLQLLSGGSELGLMWYGGELSASRYYIADRSQANLSDPTPYTEWTVTRTTQGGPAWSAIKKFETTPDEPVYGSGVLDFDVHKYLHLPINTGGSGNGNNAGEVRVYATSCNDNGTITPGTYQTLQHFIDPTEQSALPPDLYLQLELTNNVNVPEGWAGVITYIGGNPYMGYIYYGDDESIQGRAIASLSTVQPQ